MSKFWNFKNISETEAELMLYGTISESSWFDDVVSSKQFSDDLKALGDVKNIVVRINSGGGDVFAGHSIYQQLKDHPAKITTKIEGLAASAASVVFMAGDERIAPSTSFLMIHNPASAAWGEVKDFEKMIETLNVIKDGIVNAYSEKTGIDKKSISKMMDTETWMTGEDAVKNGFATRLQKEADNNLVLNGKMLIVNNVNHDLSKFKVIPSILQINAKQDGAEKLQPDANISNKSREVDKAMEIKTIADLKTAYPQLVSEIENIAASEGVKNERARIQDIEKIAKNINPDLVNKAKFIEPTDAKDLAFQALQNDAKNAVNYLKNAEDDSKESGANDVKALPNEQEDEFSKQEAQNNAVEFIAAGGNKRRGGK